MDAAFEFSFSGMNMDFAIHLTADGCPVPEGLFIDIVAEKCLLLQWYLRSAVECLALITNVSKKMATIKFIDQENRNSLATIYHLQWIWLRRTILYLLDEGTQNSKSL